MIDLELNAEELERYVRQIGPGVLTEEGQQRLKSSTALVTRVGGMGGPAALMLAMGGVGCVIIAHGGEMISQDLNRQVLGSEAIIGKQRVSHFADYIRSMNRFVEVEAIDHEPNDEEARELAARCDVILACPPTFTERLRLNRASVEAGIPFIDAAQWGMNGTLMVVKPGETACLECVYPEPPPFEDDFPVIGAISSATGSLAALEAIKILSETGTPLWGKLLLYEGFQGRMSTVELRRRADCPCCGEDAK
ncbi:MAG: HesA/MoeB/ThiF family protein [Planctomycetes bacterium]|nr:HesA/MoeB/ThiF family protein [Planctomycetota bacterium]